MELEGKGMSEKALARLRKEFEVLNTAYNYRTQKPRVWNAGTAKRED